MFKYFKRNILKIVLLFIISIILYLISTKIFQAYSDITIAAETKNHNYAMEITLTLIVVIVFVTVFDIISGFIKNRIITNITKCLKNDILEKTFHIDFEKNLLEDRNYYKSIINNDVALLKQDFFEKIIDILINIIEFVVMFFFISQIDINYSLIAILFSVVSLIQPYVFSKKTTTEGKNFSEAVQKFSQKVKEYIYGFDTIKTSAKDEVFMGKMKEDSEKLENSRFKKNIAVILNVTLLIFSVYLFKVATLVFFVNDAFIGVITLATATTLFGYANSIGNPIANISRNLHTINTTKNIREKITSFLNEKDEVYSNEEITFNESIDCENLSFSYGNNKILDNVNFKFEKNKKYIVFGESGSGKSTLIKLILNYYNNYSGNLKIDTTEIKDTNRNIILKKIDYISQSVYVFNGTIKENLTLFNNDISDEKIKEAIELADLNDMIGNLKNGLEEIIEEGGSNFSGGEKQRISIARAILSNNDILLIDEGFSALDNKSSIIVEENILKLNKTIISVSHRINQATKLYDEIVVFDKGKIIDSGSFDIIKTKESFKIFV